MRQRRATKTEPSGRGGRRIDPERGEETEDLRHVINLFVDAPSAALAPSVKGAQPARMRYHLITRHHVLTQGQDAMAGSTLNSYSADELQTSEEY